MAEKTFKSIAVAAAIAIAVACNASEKPAGKRTAALDSKAWDVSEWISVANAPVVSGLISDKTESCRAADGAAWFVSSVKNEQKVVSAKWMTSGLGVYRLFVNGRSIGTEVLKPGFTHREKTKISYTYDITDVFKASKGTRNVLAVQVTPGWWGDKIVTPKGHMGMIGSKCAFRGVLELTWWDGTVTRLGTDTQNWKAGIAGPVTHAAIFDGEEYDARILPGFATPEKLTVPEVNNEFSGSIFPSEGAEIYMRDDIALKPQQAYVWSAVEGASDSAYGKVVIDREYSAGDVMVVKPGETLVVDFGQNCAAVPSFVFKAAEGTTLTCLPGELLNDGCGSKERGMDGPEGSVHRLNLRIPEYGFILKYTFADKNGYTKYRPQCTFFGYRYVSITATGIVKIKSLKSVPVTSIAEDIEIGHITTGNELVNKLISNTVWGQRSNYLSVPTDCPQRNERLGWTADTQVFTETGTFFANTSAFFHKWMRDMRDSQSAKGGFPGVAPTAQYGDDMMRLGWADAGVIVPWTVWKQFGDSSIVDENWDAMLRFINHIEETGYDHVALKSENNNYQWADWLSYEALESHLKGTFIQNLTGRHPTAEADEYWDFLSSCYWIIDASMMADMARATGRDASRFEKMVRDVRYAARSRYLDADGGFKMEILNTMQTPALFALKCGLVEDDALEAVKARLRANFAEHGGCLQTGFLGTSILMNTLTDNGMSDIAYDLLFQRKNPSWLYSVDNGATTIWERWNSYTLEKGMGPKGMNSFNHYAYGCVCEWIWKTAAGIASDPLEPGFKHILMKPVPDRRLGSIDATYHSAAGLIKSRWHYEGSVWVWSFSIPEGSHATVVIPGQLPREYESGDWEVQVEM